MSVRTAPIPAESSRSSGVAASARATGPEPRQRVWSGEEYDRLVKQGFFSGERIELVYGEVRRVEIFRQPLHDPVSGHRYGEVRVLQPGDGVAPLAAPQAVVAVNDLLP